MLSNATSLVRRHLVSDRGDLFEVHTAASTFPVKRRILTACDVEHVGHTAPWTVSESDSFHYAPPLSRSTQYYPELI